MDEAGPSPQEDQSHQAKTPLVIGVGASASAMNSIERFFSGFSPDAEQAIVLVLQHLEAFDEGRLRGILKRLKGVRLAVPRDGDRIEGGTIYICAKDAITTIRNDRFAVRPAQQTGKDEAQHPFNDLLIGGDKATIEELERTNAKLKSSREEYQSLNEELQSANEKLTTVNGELTHRVQELTRATRDLKNLLESTEIATVWLDSDLRVMNFTSAITQVLHLVETDVGRPIAHIEACFPIEHLYDDIRRVLRTLVGAEPELTVPDSGTRYIVRILPYRSIDNFVAGVVITFIEVTAITRAEQRQRLLLAELQHRVRNTLGVVRSIARRSAETSSSVDEYASHLDGRLNAFARTQAMVSRDPDGGVDLEYLVVEEMLGCNAREGEQLRVAGPPVRFQPKAAQTFALAIHELATNAIKYGALSQPSGRIEASWRVDDTGDPIWLIFEWRERGGPRVEPPSRKGFGSELLEKTLAFELKARTSLSFDPSGLHCTIAIPLNRRLVHTPAVGV